MPVRISGAKKENGNVNAHVIDGQTRKKANVGGKNEDAPPQMPPGLANAGRGNQALVRAPCLKRQKKHEGNGNAEGDPKQMDRWDSVIGR